MGKVKSIPFAVQEGEAGATQNSRETLINMFAEFVGSGRTQIIRRQRPCLNRVLANTGDKRCIEKHKDTHYTVIGNGVYSFDGTTLSLIGTINTTTGRCTMVFNDNDQIAISDGTYLYYYNGVALAQVSLPTGVVCGTLSYLGGYAIFNNTGSGTFYTTGLNDFSTVSALDFATAESIPDNLTTTFVEHDELWLPGPTSTEIWQLTGAVDFPFSPYTNARMRRGTKAALSYAADDNTVIWYADDGIVYRAEGYVPVRISTEAVEDALASCTAAGQAAAYATIFTVKGRKFYCLTVPNELTLMFNFATRLWSRARSYGSDSWNMIGSAGHYTDYYLTEGGICSLSFDINEDEGTVVERGGVSAPGWADGKPITINSVLFDAEVGRAATGESADIMLRVARDGETFGNIRTRSLGSTGDYKRRCMFRWLGQGKKPVIEFMCTDDVNLTINSIVADLSVNE